MNRHLGFAALSVSLGFTSMLFGPGLAAARAPVPGAGEGVIEAAPVRPSIGQPAPAARPADPVTVPSDAGKPFEGPELEVPFACGSRVTISQSHGTFSHVGTDRWAWDFRVPDGTPVHAAHDGVVRMVRSDSVRGGCDRSFGPDSNYVILLHESGLETQYLHFSKVFVRLGQRVKAGTVIGEVGRTGFSCGSHLHFQLQRSRDGKWANQSVPARFRKIGDPLVDQEIVSANCQGPAAPGEPMQAEAGESVLQAEGDGTPQAGGGLPSD